MTVAGKSSARRRLTQIGLAGVAGLALLASGAEADAGTPTADLQLELQSSPASVEPGATVTYNATITNLGPNTATVVDFGITVDSTVGGVFTAATPSSGACTVFDDAVACGNLGSLAVNEVATVTMTLAVVSDAPVGTVITGDGLTTSAVNDNNGANNQVIVTNTVVAPPTTTTTTMPASTTTVSAATTTGAPTTTVSAATTTGAPTTIAGGLPATGSPDRGLLFVACTVVVFGFGLVLASRRPQRVG